MSFKDDIPDFKSIPDGDLYMHSVPDEAWTSLESLIRKAASGPSKLKAIINNIAEITFVKDNRGEEAELCRKSLRA
jgi:hypothetical protein